MNSVSTIVELRLQIAGWRAAGDRIAFVPTMGNLHEGHLKLVDAAKEQADRVVVSIFVNPMQFGANEDLDAYPKTPEQDSALLEERGADLLFLPAVADIYPPSKSEVTVVEVPEISDILCGASRPGHFRGVTTVVAKLFNMVQPDVALFGEKVLQQLIAIRRMTTDLNFPIEIIGVPIVRESDGLAMSSRNGYLNESERSVAPRLYQIISKIREKLQSGVSDHLLLEEEAAAKLHAAGFRCDYITIRRLSDLGEPDEGESQLAILVAAWLGTTRLIDNIVINLD
ncbi:MAG: pantoate--beta-alanine ligase [Gammaproteobacteria bacterium]|nr:pantoate--beta-alanine ligase [Gammaproteobacteria bacterium]